jgi:hypothetical protein
MPRKPWVTSNPVLAPFSSSSALVPTVVPWQKKRDVARRHARIDQFFDAVQNRLKRFFGRRRNFRDGDFAAVFVEENKIRKRAPGVYGNSILRHSPFRLPLKILGFNLATRVVDAIAIQDPTDSITING